MAGSLKRPVCGDGKKGDGYVTSAEVGTNAILREALPAFAANHSGRLSRPEFVALRRTISEGTDISPHDYLTFAEYELLILMRRSGWADRNHAGWIQMPELQAVLTSALTLLNRNQDGVITGEERAFFSPAHLQAMDLARTGSITLE